MVDNSKGFHIVNNVIMVLLSACCVLPFVLLLISSLTEESVLIRNGYSFFPEAFSLDAYRYIFSGTSKIIKGYGITIFISLVGTVTGILMTLLLAYPLSRKTLRGRKFFTLLFIFTMYFQGGMIPDYILMNKLGLLETMSSLVLPLAFSAYNLVIMKNSLESSIPDSLIESALIDGANHYTILGRIVLPLSKPILATLTLFYAVGRWNTYSDAMFYIKQNTSLRPLQLKLYYLIVAATESIQGSINDVAVSTVTDPEILKAACIVFATVPIILVYPFVQKYFVQGTMIGAVKG